MKTKKNLPPVFDEDDAISFKPSETTPSTANTTTQIASETPKPDPQLKKRKIIESAASALTNLGYQRSDAMQALLAVCENLDDIDEGQAIHSALQHIGKMKELA